MNYLKKHKELNVLNKTLGEFNITIGDEQLPNGIVQIAKVYIAKNLKIHRR